MAIRAAGVSSWGELFAGWQAKTRLFPTGAFDLPSTENPRLAGDWRGLEYLDFIPALQQGELLEDATSVRLLSTASRSIAALATDSSPGAYGAYPFIDFEHGYIGLLARQGNLGSFVETNGLKVIVNAAGGVRVGERLRREG